MRTIAVDGGTLEIDEHGSGPALVMLHSLLTDASAFDAVVPELARDRRVILVNLPGFGKSSPAGATIESMADRVATLFPALELKTDATLLGNGFDPQRFAQACLALAALDLRADAHVIMNLTLVLVGSLDTATPPEMALELADLIPTAQYAEIVACGHAPMIQAPSAFLATLKRFLE